MTHCMNLHHEPFELIAQGLKTIELRLLDEKRKKISVGDKLVFTDTQVPSATIECRVIALHLFDSFDELYAALPLDKCGYLPHELKTASPKDMEAYYSPEKQRQYGVVGIELEIIR